MDEVGTSSAVSKQACDISRECHFNGNMTDEEIGLSDDSDKDPDFNFFKENKIAEVDDSDSDFDDDLDKKTFKKSKRKKTKINVKKKNTELKYKSKTFAGRKKSKQPVSKSNVVVTSSRHQELIDSSTGTFGTVVEDASTFASVTWESCGVREETFSEVSSLAFSSEQQTNTSTSNSVPALNRSNDGIVVSTTNDGIVVSTTNSNNTREEEEAVDNIVVQNSRLINSSEKTKYYCEICPRVFTSLACSIKHKSVCKEEYNCIKCDYKVKCLKNLKQHIRNVHSEGKWGCTSCDEKFRSEFKLKVHMKTHNPTRSECPKCKKTFKSVHVMHVHKSKVHCDRPKSAKTWICPYCNKSFKSDRGLRYHKAIHKKAEEVQVSDIAMASDEIVDEVVEVQETQSLQDLGHDVENEILVVYVEE